MTGRDDFTPRPDLALGEYIHYKGNRYEVVDFACHSETLEWLVIYKPLYDHPGMPDVWVRPYEMFVEDVEVDGRKIPRFQKVDAQNSYSSNSY
jgi:hypothetical protein